MYVANIITCCSYIESITYTYEVSGTEVTDLDTGKSYNYYRCIPLRFEK